jgi:hypothetical protein
LDNVVHFFQGVINPIFLKADNIYLGSPAMRKHALCCSPNLKCKPLICFSVLSEVNQFLAKLCFLCSPQQIVFCHRFFWQTLAFRKKVCTHPNKNLNPGAKYPKNVLGKESIPKQTSRAHFHSQLRRLVVDWWYFPCHISPSLLQFDGFPAWLLAGEQTSSSLF